MKSRVNTSDPTTTLGPNQRTLGVFSVSVHEFLTAKGHQAEKHTSALGGESFMFLRASEIRLRPFR